MARLPHETPDATFRLLLAAGLGPATLGRLEAALGSHDRIAGVSASRLAEAGGLAAAEAERLSRAIETADPVAERETMAAAGACLVLRGDEDYPPLLEVISTPPAALWLRGRLHDADRLALAVVGSRRCTVYGREQAGRFGALLAGCGLVVVSGGARGIDGEAHRGALRVGGRTIAVMGCGLGQCYPPQHEALFEQIVKEGGALLSALPMLAEPRAAHFPARNRIIAGLALGVFVIEAARRSGALITARIAAELGREVMALPGRVDSPASGGCLAAVRDGWAALVTNHAEVLDQLDCSSQLVRGALEAAGHPDARRTATLFDGSLSEGQQAIVSALEGEERALSVEQLASRTGFALSRLLADLTLLQIRGRLVRDGSGVQLRRYCD
jgi:DNA processing protein